MTVRDTPAGQIVRGHLDRDPVAFEDTDAESPEFSGNGRKNLGSIIERDAKGGTGENLGNGPFELD